MARPRTATRLFGIGFLTHRKKARANPWMATVYLDEVSSNKVSKVFATEAEAIEWVRTFDVATHIAIERH
jgi:hypothetical protein